MKKKELKKILEARTAGNRNLMQNNMRLTKERDIARHDADYFKEKCIALNKEIEELQRRLDTEGIAVKLRHFPNGDKEFRVSVSEIVAGFTEGMKGNQTRTWNHDFDTLTVYVEKPKDE